MVAHDIQTFGLGQMVELGTALRNAGASATSMEEAATRIVATLRESLVGTNGAPAVALARLYKAHPYGKLPDDLRRFADAVFPGEALAPETRCLTLLATHGREASWCRRTASSGHQAIPLPRREIVEQLPMVAQLVKQLGLEVEAIVQPSLMIDLTQRAFNVFHVPVARRSPFIPAQAEFVERYNIESVLGFGGVLADNDLYSVILFFETSVSRDVAELFRTVALNVKLSLLPFSSGKIFS